MNDDLPAFPWGKLDTEVGTSHHLAHHSADVVAVFLGLLQMPSIRARAEAALGRDIREDEVSALATILFLHDIGKIAPAFQAKGLPAERHSLAMGHLECGQHWLRLDHDETALGGQILRLMAMGTDLGPWLDVAFAHHGRPLGRVDEARSRSAFTAWEGYDWKAAEATFGTCLKEWIPEATDLPPASPRFLHFMCGLFSLADWIGSDRRGFAHIGTLDKDYCAIAQSRARRHLAEIGMQLGPESLRGAPDWALVSEFAAPRPAQKTLSGIPIDTQLVILEAETGAGKTEAALWHFARLVAAGKVDSLYFAVPTRAAARQLHRRVNTALGRMFQGQPEAVLAIPGQIVAGDAVGARLPGFEVRWDDGPPPAMRWAAEHATRFLAAKVAVGTVDQAMLAALQVKHAHMRGTLLSRSLVVVDEVHASDHWMTGIQKAMLDDHLALGGHALLMSATLGSAARTMWTGTPLPTPEDAAATPYPAVWAGAVLHEVEAEPDAGKTVEMQAHPGWTGEAAATLALKAARDGARVLVVRNTVDRARETWRACIEAAPGLVMDLDGTPCLHHSRYAAEDRQRLDARVEELLGKGSPPRGVIVIGTQTLEQSLDISAEILITDLCPVDVLLQRIGRLHRHRVVARPAGYETARCLVLHPTEGLDALTRRAENGLGVFEDAAVLSGVYLDVCVLQATLAAILHRPAWQIPEMNRALVEAATHPQTLDDLADRFGWERHRMRVAGKGFADAQAARNVVLDRTKPLAPFPQEEAIRTRLGGEGVLLAFEHGTIGPFGSPIRSLAVPARWSIGLDPETLRVDQVGDGLRVTVSDRAFLYDSSGLSREA